MNRFRANRRSLCVLLATSVCALTTSSVAWAHARVSPAVIEAKQSQMFSLAVPTEKSNATTTKLELGLPSGFSIDSFAPSPGWKRVVHSTGSGENAVIEKVTWSGGHAPIGENAFFQFLADTDKASTYTLDVTQTYSDGTVVNCSGPESSDSPAPTVEAASSFGGGGANSTLAIVALAVAAVALVIAIVGVAGGSGRPLA